MDPLDCTLDEIADGRNQRGRKRRRNNYSSDYRQNYNNHRNNYNSYNNSNYDTNPYRKRFRNNNNNYQTRHYTTSNYNRNHQRNNHQQNNQSHYNQSHSYHHNQHKQYRHNNHHHNNHHNIHHRHHHHHNNKFNNNHHHIEQSKLPPPPSSNYYIEAKEEQAPPSPDAQYGYVTLIMKGDNYIPGALILAHSLRLVNTKHSLICMVTNDVSSKARSALQCLYDHVIEVPYIEYTGMCKRMKTDKQEEKYKKWACSSFTKWNILQINALLTDIKFSKLFFLDSDKIVLTNIDHIFIDPKLQCPAGTFSSPWTNKRNNRGLMDHYPPHMKHGDVVPAQSIYNALYKNGFVAVGTGMLFEPNLSDFEKFIKMLDAKWISDEYMCNNVDFEKRNSKFSNGDGKLEKNENERQIGFKNCYSMLDEQSIVFYYFYHRRKWTFVDTKYNFIPWHFKWLEDENGVLDIPVILHFFGMKPWNLSPLEWRDLQCWWGLVFNLLNFASKDVYKWKEEDIENVSSFFDLSKVNELPLDLLIEEEENNVGDEDNVKKKGRGFQDFSDIVDDKEREKAKLKLRSKVTCFWCYEMAKREGLDPVELIKNGDYDAIQWIFHCPIDPLTGKLCCPKLKENGLK